MALLGGCDNEVIVEHFDRDLSIGDDLAVPEDLSVVDMDGPYGTAYWKARQAACAAAGGVCVVEVQTHLEYYFDLGPSPLLGNSTCDYTGGATLGVWLCCRPHPWPCEAAGGSCHLQSQCAPGDSFDGGACPDVTLNTPAPCCGH
jgi:hypothetical protein